jgi:hypothetical protein
VGEEEGVFGVGEAHGRGFPGVAAGEGREHNRNFERVSRVFAGRAGWQDGGMEKGVTAEAAVLAAAAAAGAAAGAAGAARLWRAGRGTARLLCRPVVALPPGRVLCGCVVDECCEGGEGMGGEADEAGLAPLHGLLRGSVQNLEGLDLTQPALSQDARAWR